MKLFSSPQQRVPLLLYYYCYYPTPVCGAKRLVCVREREKERAASISWNAVVVLSRSNNKRAEKKF